MIRIYARLTLLAAFGASVFSDAPVRGQVTVPSGYVGQYRLAFVTSGTTTATSADINYYNTFVTNDAASSPALAALATTWKAIGSTPSVNANDNTNTNPGVSSGYPIYNLAGSLVAPNNRTLWNPNILLNAPIDVDEHGHTVVFAAGVWTGTNAVGTAYNNGYLGSLGNPTGTAIVGIASPLQNYLGDWIGSSGTNNTAPYSLYGMSGVLNATATTAGGGRPTVGGVDADFTNATVSTSGTFTSNYKTEPSQSALQTALGSAATGAINFGLAGTDSNGVVLSNRAVQFWDMHFTGTFTGDTSVTVHFDPTLIGTAPLSSLVIWHYTGGAWVPVANETINTVNDTITFTTDSFSPFILGAAVPEPSTMVLAGLGGIALLWCRRPPWTKSTVVVCERLFRSRVRE